jgi:hypothetical protein
MQEIGGHHHGDGRLTVVAVPNEGVQLAIKWHGLADHWFIAGQTMAKEDLAWVVQRCSGVSDEHQVMLGRPLVPVWATWFVRIAGGMSRAYEAHVPA